MSRMVVALAVVSLLGAALRPAAAQLTLNAGIVPDTTNSLSMDSTGTGYALCRASGAYTSNAEFIVATLTVNGLAGAVNDGSGGAGSSTVGPSQPTGSTRSGDCAAAKTLYNSNGGLAGCNCNIVNTNGAPGTGKIG
jgi:hypothetical protein